MSDIVTRGKFPAPIDQEAVAADWRARGYSCGLFVDPPGREWNDFVDGTDELVIVQEGRLEMGVGDEAFVAEPGNENFIPKAPRHSLKNIHAGTTRWLYGYD